MKANITASFTELGGFYMNADRIVIPFIHFILFY